MSGDISSQVALLDRHRPDWRGRVDVAKLDMEDAWKCVLGQVYGDWFTGMRAIGLDGAAFDAEDEERSLGFAFVHNGYRDAWVEEIARGDPGVAILKPPAPSSLMGRLKRAIIDGATRVFLFALSR